MTSSANFLKISEWPVRELQDMVDLAIRLKKDDFREPIAKNHVLGLFFNNPSLRTQISFQVAAVHLGASSVLIQPGKGAWNIETTDGTVMDGINQEHVRELVPVLCNYVDLLGIRYFASLTDRVADMKDEIVRHMADLATVPVVNMESAQSHPCQGMADWMTLNELFGNSLKNVNVLLTWAPHPNPLPRAVPNSAMEAIIRSGANLTVACPSEMMPDTTHTDEIKTYAEKAGNSFRITDDRKEAFENVDVVYAKSWHGGMLYDDRDKEKSVRAGYSNWTVTKKDMAATRSARFMHCLPIRRNVVATDEVLNDPGAVHIMEAGNRLHIQKAILMKLWNLSL